MPRAVTAIYRAHATAALVRDELERLGLSRHAITVIPEGDGAPDPAATGAGGTAVGTAGGAYMALVPPNGDAVPPGTYLDTAYAGGIHADAFDRLHDLHLPEEDTRIYQQAIRNGDVVVSVEVEEEADLARVEEIMRRPEEAHDLDALTSRSGGGAYEPRRRPLGPDHDERWAGRRDETVSSPYTRSYVRGAALASARRGG